MRLVEYWRWFYRHPKGGEVCQTTSRLTAEQAAKYPNAQPIPGTMLLREFADESDDETTPGAFRPE